MFGAYCWLLWLSLGGLATFPQFPSDWFKAVSGVGHSCAIWPQPWHLKHLKELGVPPVGCTLMPSISPLTVLPLISTYGSHCPVASWCAAIWGSLANTSPAVVGAGAAGNTPVSTSLSTVSPWGYLGH